MTKIVFAAAALAMTGLTTSLAVSPASAQMPSQTPSQTIATSGYNLNSAAGYAALAGRINRAANQVCGNVDLRNLDVAPEFIACRNFAREDAMAQLDDIASGASVTVVASR